MKESKSVAAKPTQNLKKNFRARAWLRLHVSNLCNYACPNCHVFSLVDNELPAKQMKIETMAEAIETYTQILYERNVRWLRISIYGGETFLNKKAVFATVERFGLSHNGVDIEWVMNTNGSLITDEDIEIVKRLKIDLHISCDGGESIHNQTRPSKNKKPAFDYLMNALGLVKKHKLSVQINSYVMPQNIDTLREIIDIARSHGVHRIYLDHFYAPKGLEASLVLRKYKDAFVYGRNNGVQLSAPWSFVVMNMGTTEESPKTTLFKSIEVNVDGTFYSAAFPRTKDTPRQLSELRNFLDSIECRDLDSEMNEFYTEKCQTCSLYRACYGTAIRQFSYHIGQEHGYESTCDFMRLWVHDLTKKVYLSTRSRYLVVSHYPIEKAEFVLGEIDRASELLVRAFGELPRKFKVFLLDNRMDLEIYGGGHSWPEWVKAFSVGGSYIQYELDPITIYIHEICHVYLSQITKYKPPQWLAEGVCEYLQGRELDAWPQKMLNDGTLPAMSILENPGPRGLVDLDPRRVFENPYYSMAHSFVSYLIRQVGWDKFSEVLVDPSESYGVAFKKITTLDLSNMELGWRESLGQS